MTESDANKIVANTSLKESREGCHSKKTQIATNRKAYQQLSEIIGRYQRECGQNSAVPLTDELKRKYDRCLAFLDELRNMYSGIATQYFTMKNGSRILFLEPLQCPY